MTITKRMTRRFKEDNCSQCTLANKKALREGNHHCKHLNPSIKNGICKDRKNGHGTKRRVR